MSTTISPRSREGISWRRNTDNGRHTKTTGKDGQDCDATGRLRFIYRTPNWEDFVQLAVTEIRHFGGTSIQVARRLRAMLENLIPAVPDERAALLRQELSLLQRSAERAFPEPEDRALAAISDSQGMGGMHANGQAASAGQEASRP